MLSYRTSSGYHEDVAKATYTYILTEYYLSGEKREDVDIQIEMDLTHSKYYRLKNQAILLFGIMLWHTVLEECVYNTAPGEVVAFG